MQPDCWEEERIAWAAGKRCIAGMDEAGRGALAGPVVAACVILYFEKAPGGIDDSKLLTPDSRNRLFYQIMSSARAVGVGIVGPEAIDRINILQASHEAMRIAFSAIPRSLTPDLVLIDGLAVRPFPADQVALVKGDGRSISIAAASIIAKVTRDRLMCDAHDLFPDYGFASHKGYGAPAHLCALARHGASAIHRRSFKPVAACTTVTLNDAAE